MSLGYFLYKVSTKSYFLLIHLIAPFHKRANALWNGQKQPLEITPKKPNEKRLWLHVASLGEFEQARPVLNLLKSDKQNLKICVSFFSPSGFENRKNDPIIDYAFYLPFENKKNVSRLVDLLNPDFVIWVKYDFWIDYLHKISNSNIPLFLIAAQFNSSQYYFKFPGNFQLNTFKKFTKIFTQNQASTAILKEYGIESIFTGDPRYDNVYRIKNEKKNIEMLQGFWNDKPVIVCGSTYIEEEQMIADLRNQFPNKYQIIIAPHFIDTSHIESILKLFPGAIKYSEIESSGTLLNTNDTLIIDNIGLLAHLYQKADIAIIGGGFKSGGLHNILEATVNEIPVLFGPKINRFPEAKELVQRNIGFVFNNALELKNCIESINHEKLYMIKSQAKAFMASNLGAAKSIAESILSNLKQ